MYLLPLPFRVIDFMGVVEGWNTKEKWLYSQSFPFLSAYLLSLDGIYGSELSQHRLNLKPSGHNVKLSTVSQPQCEAQHGLPASMRSSARNPSLEVRLGADSQPQCEAQRRLPASMRSSARNPSLEVRLDVDSQLRGEAQRGLPAS
eukprot:g27609.t1